MIAFYRILNSQTDAHIVEPLITKYTGMGSTLRWRRKSCKMITMLMISHVMYVAAMMISTICLNVSTARVPSVILTVIIDLKVMFHLNKVGTV